MQLQGLLLCLYSADKQQTVAGVDFNGFEFASKEGEGLTLYGFIEKLTDITTFHANSNGFTGGIPKQISTIPYFFELDLSKKLSGSFPQEILGAKKLTYLDLRFNSSSGAVPPELFTLDMDTIFLNNNYFDQNLPDNIGATPAIFITLQSNKFIGPIPKSIGQAKNLQG
jgi:hypothetical protein